MPSVRVRRGSQYATLLGEDGQPEQHRISRPRSRTLASLYGPPNVADLEAGRPHTQSTLRQGTCSSSESDKAGPSHTVNVEEARPASSYMQGRVADHILTKSRSSAALLRHSSQDYLRAEGGRIRSVSVTDYGPQRVTLEGSQVDLNVPRDAGPGVLESNLSLQSMASNPFRSDGDSVRNHEDDIVEYVVSFPCQKIHYTHTLLQDIWM